MPDLTENWQNIEQALGSAVSIAWDGCHKIYILLDEEQHQQMDGYGYDPLLRLDAIGADRALALLREWYADSCALRFINTVRTNRADPNEGFTALISQFEDEGDDA